MLCTFSLSVFLFRLCLIQRGDICQHFYFGLEESHSYLDLFLGVKQQVVLIYGDFIMRKECFQNACLLLMTPSRAHMQFVLCYPNERLLNLVFNKEHRELAKEIEGRH